MRYWLTQLIYYIRRLIPLYANDSSKIYSAYSAQLLERLSAPTVSAEDRYAGFLHFSEHFIDDISGDRVAASLMQLHNTKKVIEGLSAKLRQSPHPRASILLRKTKAALRAEHGLTFTEADPLNFYWSKELEEKFSSSIDITNANASSALNYLKRPYQLWKFFFRSDQASLFGSSLRQHYLKRLSSPQTSDTLWLKTFEDYSKLFKSPADISIMAENLKFRHPARDLALLDFSYRVRYKKPKVLLFHRRMRLALADTLGQELPDYRGTELTKIFFNPLEEERLRKREAQNKKLKAAAKAKADKREQKRKKLVDAASKRREKRLRDRKKLVDKSVKRREKILKARAKVRRRRKDNFGSKAARYLTALTAPLRGPIFLRNYIAEIGDYSPVQLRFRYNSEGGDIFYYSNTNRRSLRSNPNLAIFYVTGRLNEYLDVSLLAEFSKIVILNASAMKDAALKEAIKEQLSDDINIECFSPAQLLIKPYTPEHKTISNLSDMLAEKIIDIASAHRALSRYIEADLTEEYVLTLSDNLFRYVERFYAANLFFDTIDPSTPVFFSSARDSFQFTLAKTGFTKIVVLGGKRLLGTTRGATSKMRTVPPGVWAPKLRNAFNAIQENIRNHVSSAHAPKNKSILIATHSRSSLHKASAAMLQEDLSEHYNTQILDFAPRATASEGAQNIYRLTHGVDRGLIANIQIALLPAVSRALSDISLHDYDTDDMISDIAIIAARNAGQLMGHTAMYRAVKEEYAGHKKAAAILVPGRYAEIRAIARAFHALNLPTIDIQLLFLSTMARYKAPIATHNAVIDTVTRDFYQQNYGIDAKKISVIGSITRDADIKRAKHLGRAESLHGLGFNPHARVITLACQPGFETATYEAVKALASYLPEHPKISLVVKLHPAQSPAHKSAIETLLEKSTSPKMAQRWRVLHKEPFWSIIPATTILMSYFSNVCLQACAFGIPVLSLPGGGTRPDPDFEAIGLARNITDLAILPAQLDYILNLSKTAQRREPPFAYIEQNPHMAGHDALGNLQTVLARLMKL